MFLGLLPALFFIVAFVSILRSRSHAKKLPPGPPGLPLIGNLPQLLGVEFRWLTFISWTQKYGSLFSLRVGGKPVIVIGNHKVAMDLLEKRASIYSDRPTSVVPGIMSGGLAFAFLPRNHTWRRMRKASHEILNAHASKQYHNFQNVEAILLTKDLLKTPEFYVRHLHRATTSSLLSILYALPPCPDPFEPSLVLITELTQDVLNAAAPGQYLVEFFPILRYLPSRLCKWKRFAESVFSRSDMLFSELYKRVEKRVENGEIIPCVTTSLIQDPIHNDLTLQEKAWLIGTLYAAGSETTAKQMLWFFLSMALHPDVQAKAQAQIDDIVGRERLPSLDDYERLPYIRAIMKELLRWRGIGPLGVPHAAATDDFYEGYFIPKGTNCIVNVWALNHDKDVYGDDADLFRPERHLDGSGQIQLVASQETKDDGHCTFGFGRRVCVGRHVALNNIFIQIASILWCFTITPGEDETGKPMVIDENKMVDDGLTVQPLPTNKYKITPRFPEVEEVLRNAAELNGIEFA